MLHLRLNTLSYTHPNMQAMVQNFKLQYKTCYSTEILIDTPLAMPICSFAHSGSSRCTMK